LPQKQAPAKEKSLEGFRSNRRPKPGLRYSGNKEKERLPKWVAPAIRMICAEFDAAKAVPHVWAGVESVLFLPCPKFGDAKDRMEGKLPALVAAVFFNVMTKLTGKEISRQDYARQVKKLLDILHEIRENEVVAAKVGEEDEAWEGWEIDSKKDVDHWLSDLAVRGWIELDWSMNIEVGSGASGTMEGERDESTDGEEDKEATKRASKRMRGAGLGTMMQAKFDYLSDEKREEYAMWKAAMLAKIDDLVAEGVMNDDMDIAEG
jgi:origin recognition complex subunit 6